MRLCSESQGSAVHEPSPHTWPVSKTGQSVSPPKQGCVDPPPRLCPRRGHLGSCSLPVSKARPPGFPLPACVHGGATWGLTPRLCPRQGHLGSHSPPVSTVGPPGFPLPTCVQGRATWVPASRLYPRQGHPGSRFPPVSKARPPGFSLPTCVHSGATWVPASCLCPRQGHPGSRSLPVSMAGPRAPPPVLRERRWGQGPPAPLLPASPTDWALPGQAPGAQGCPCCRVQSPATLRAPLGAVEAWSCFRVHSVEK